MPTSAADVSTARLQRFDTIQVLRFVAALLVVATHSTFYAHERLYPGSAIWPPGARGVDIFFVISGFVMWHSSANLVGRAGGWWIFARRRLLRIVPMYWLATTVKVLIMFVSPSVALHARLGPAVLMSSYLFLPCFNVEGVLEPLLGVGWTLNLEMFFYLIFVVALLTQRPLTWIGAALVSCVFGALLRGPKVHVWQFYMNDMILEFLFGMLLAQYSSALRPPRALAVVLLACGMAALLAMPDHLGLPRSLVFGLPALAIVGGAVWIDVTGPWRAPASLLYLGNASYMLYLVHPMVAPAVPAALARLHLIVPVLSVAGSLVVAVAAAALLHSFVEVPLSRRLSPLLHVRRSVSEQL